MERKLAAQIHYRLRNKIELLFVRLPLGIWLFGILVHIRLNWFWAKIREHTTMCFFKWSQSLLCGRAIKVPSITSHLNFVVLTLFLWRKRQAFRLVSLWSECSCNVEVFGSMPKHIGTLIEKFFFLSQKIKRPSVHGYAKVQKAHRSHTYSCPLYLFQATHKLKITCAPVEMDDLKIDKCYTRTHSPTIQVSLKMLVLSVGYVLSEDKYYNNI